MTKRRELLFLAGAFALPGFAHSQQADRRYKIGWIATSDAFSEPYAKAFVERLAQLGLVEGRNLSLERRHPGGNLEKLPALAAELAKQRCDLFFAGGAAANLRALANTSGETPIVFVAVDFDPVAEGYVASFARPGGRITGVTSLQSELPAKRLELLKELFPRARKVAVLTNEQTTGQLGVARDAAKRLQLELHVVDMKRPPFQFEPAFAEAVRAGADSLLVLGSGLWVPERRKITELALKSGLPSVFHQAQWAQFGGLISYGFDFPEMWRRGAEMSVRVLHGAKPSEIPFEQPSVYELALNMKTAKALGITVAPTFLTRVNKVIE